MTDSKKETREQKFKRLFPWVDPKYASGPWADPEELNVVELPPEIQAVKEQMEAEFTKPYDLPWLPGHVLKRLVEAAKVQGQAQADLVQKAWDHAKLSHLADRARGRIRVKDETVEPMPEAVKEQLRNLNAQRREERRALKARVQAFEPPKKPKIPVFADPDRQREVQAKYNWVIPETFRQDPDKAGGTIVDIRCQTCSGPRTVHLADAFQVKLCLPCKANNGKHKQALGQ